MNKSEKVNHYLDLMETHGARKVIELLLEVIEGYKLAAVDQATYRRGTVKVKMPTGERIKYACK